MKIQVLYVEPMQEPRLREIEPTLANLQMLVGGYFEAVYPFDDPVVLVCNEEGKYNGMLPNRAMVNDIIYGPFFIAGIGEEDFESIPDNLIQKYTEFFSAKKCLLKGENMKEQPNLDKMIDEIQKMIDENQRSLIRFIHVGTLMDILYFLKERKEGEVE